MHPAVMAIKDDHRVTGASPGPQFLAAGGILAALGAASCCVMPFALFTLGVSGAWIGTLTALEPYQPVFAAVASACLVYGFYLVYRKTKTACAGGSYCAARPQIAWPKSVCGRRPFSSSSPLVSHGWWSCFYERRRHSMRSAILAAVIAQRSRPAVLVRASGGKDSRSGRQERGLCAVPADHPTVIDARSRRQGR
jgi:hypothetical protein